MVFNLYRKSGNLYGNTYTLNYNIYGNSYKFVRKLYNMAVFPYKQTATCVIAKKHSLIPGETYLKISTEKTFALTVIFFGPFFITYIVKITIIFITIDFKIIHDCVALNFCII